MTHNIKELVENQKQAAVTLIDRAIFKLPDGMSHGASRQLVDLIVGAALLEGAMLTEAIKEKANNSKPARAEEEV